MPASNTYQIPQKIQIMKIYDSGITIIDNSTAEI